MASCVSDSTAFHRRFKFSLRSALKLSTPQPTSFPEYFWAISKVKNIILVDIERTLLIHDYSLLYIILYLLGVIPF